MKTFYFLLGFFIAIGRTVSVESQVLQPADLQYLGAFRLPEGSGNSDWNYSGYGATYYPSGDPAGPDDGFPGSIFAIGHDQQQFVSEISIPIPKQTKQLDQLNYASTLQPFTDIKGARFGDLEIPRADLEYLPAQGTQKTCKLHFCWGQHFQFERAPSHGWCEMNLATPAVKGPWFMGAWSNYLTDDYLFEIPEAWANQHVNGKRLATGRFRDGGWGGQGPALFAYEPWLSDTPPAAQTTISNVTQLLTYGQLQNDQSELVNADSMKMIYYKDPDEWSGGAWLTAGTRAAVIFIGTKAMGQCWYGFSNGVVWPENGPWPPVPAPPHDQRGWWADSIQAQILFYDPQDLADVVHGKKLPWHPQPSAVMNLNPFLLKPGYDHPRYKMNSLGACCYDRTHGKLYLFERLSDEEKSVVHCFQISAKPTAVKMPGHEPYIHLFQNYPNPFNDETVISFSMTHPDDVVITVYDLLGRPTATLLNQRLASGLHRLSFSCNGLATGMYVYKIKVGDNTAMQKMVILR